MIEPLGIPQDPEGSVTIPTVLSLLVPGLGQAWLGQWGRGMRIFAGSATLCFGLGLANLMVAYDAYSLATLRRHESISTRRGSMALGLFTLVWSGFIALIDAFVDGPIQGPAVVIHLPLMVVSHLGGGRGFRRR